VFSFQNASQAHIFKDGGAAIFAGALTQNSDYRIKGDVSEIDPDAALAALLRARPVEYARTDIPDDSRHAGFIAHELQEVLPLLVEGEKDATRDEMQDMSTGPQLPPKQVPELQSVNYIGLGPYLVAAVKALAERVAALEAKQAA
jgi:hypothetical protein